MLNLGGSEVLVYIEGSPSSINEFMELLYRERPPPADIESLIVEEVEPVGLKGFRIEKSDSQVTARSQIPPDLGICRDCIREILDPNNRRYRYPWNSCAWCGPRYSMMYRVPYDRENTSMGKYRLCRECLKEYTSLENVRRYHAQGISCPLCGPNTILRDSQGNPVKVRDPVREAARLLEEGYIIAVKGVGGYHIAGDPYNDSVVSRIRQVKSRPRQPLAVMARDCDKVGELARVTSDDCLVLESPERPILLVEKRRPEPLSPGIAPGLDTYGVMLPYTGLQVLLLHDYKSGVLVMTSGNRHGLPMCRSLSCILDQFEGEIDYILDHDREIVHRVDDSLLRRTLGKTVFLRRSRGYAPRWLHLKMHLGESLALGAELQNAGGVSFEDKIVLTPYIGDMDEPGQVEELFETLEWFVQQYRIKPHYLVIDKHPAYTYRRQAPLLAEKYDAEIIEAYHHHMHALSLIADAGLDPNTCYPALTLDGTGYGADETIWGGEALTVEGARFERIAHIGVFPLPGGDSAARKPAKIIVGILSMHHTLDEVLDILGKHGILGSQLSRIEVEIAYRQAVSVSRSHMTSSTGRLLDAIAALLGVSVSRTYEGEPAITLEAHARMAGAKGRVVEDLVGRGDSVVDPYRALLYVIDAWNKTGLRGGLKAAGDVMYSIGYLLADRVLGECKGSLLLSGGASVNDYIARGAFQAVLDFGGRLVLHRRIPPGDGGLAAGQLLYSRLVNI